LSGFVDDLRTKKKGVEIALAEANKAGHLPACEIPVEWHCDSDNPHFTFAAWFQPLARPG